MKDGDGPGTVRKSGAATGVRRGSGTTRVYHSALWADLSSSLESSSVSRVSVHVPLPMSWDRTRPPTLLCHLPTPTPNSPLWLRSTPTLSGYTPRPFLSSPISPPYLKVLNGNLQVRCFRLKRVTSCSQRSSLPSQGRKVTVLPHLPPPHPLSFFRLRPYVPTRHFRTYPSTHLRLRGSSGRINYLLTPSTMTRVSQVYEWET